MFTQNTPNTSILTQVNSKSIAGTSLEQALNPLVTTDIEYNSAEVREFLALVFGDDLPAGEEVAVWAQQPHVSSGYPSAVDDLMNKFDNPLFKAAKKCYFATSTLKRDDDNLLRHKSDNFCAMYVLVLDDIGTKVSADIFPKELEPTYIIESSKGNYQYGFVLEEPITCLHAAKSLVSLCYEAGFSDNGGKLPVKKVRLPCGVNGKQSKKDPSAGVFPVTLTKSDGPYWEPQKLLDLMDVAIKWGDVVELGASLAQHKNIKALGSSPWSHAQVPSLDGVVDPVLEWLVEEGHYQGDDGKWATITCPNAHMHSNGGDETAGYIPLGRASDGADCRVFNCFHDHCKELSTADFLQWVAANNGPRAAVRDSVAQLTSEWIYDAVENKAWQIKGEDITTPIAIQMEAFKNVHHQTVINIMPDGKEKASSAASLWLKSPSRVDVYGRTFDPTKTARILKQNGRLMLNDYNPPVWDGLNTSEADVEQFLDFVGYLVPDDEAREYFLDWLAAKVQNMGFRGAAIVMVAKRQGTGRGTLMKIISRLFGEHNIANEKFSDIVGDSNYNEWQSKCIVAADETCDTGSSNFYKVYERLKDIVDPAPKMTTINPKYGKKYEMMVHSSFMFFSNHQGALMLSEEDRRFYVIDNVITPRSPEYFVDFRQWVDKSDEKGRPTWGASLWNYLTNRKVNIAEMYKPAPTTRAKTKMLVENKQPIELAVDAVLANANSPYVTVPDVMEAVERVSNRIELYDIKNWKAVIKRIVREKTLGFDDGVICKVGGKSRRPRVITKRMKDHFNQTHLDNAAGAHERKMIKAHVNDQLKLTTKYIGDTVDSVNAALDLADV